MGFFIKLLKELNSAQNEKFISLAIVLGAINGFLPFFNIYTFFIFIIVFIIRVPLGLFFASWGVFSALGYFLDPLFDKTGYLILTSQSLKPFFTFLYNLPLMRWSGYNNTVVTGSLVIGVLTGTVLYFLLNGYFSLYRKTFFPFFEKHRLLKWIVPSKTDKKTPLRLSGVLTLTTAGILLYLAGTLFLDPVLKTVLQSVLSKTLHKKVYIASLDTSLKNFDMKIKNIHIGEIKISKIYVKADPYLLLWKKTDIKNLLIEKIISDKNFQYYVQKKEVSKNSKTHISIPDINVPSADTFIKKQTFKSAEALNRLKKDYKKFESLCIKNKTLIKEEKNKIKQIQTQIRSLSEKIKNIKNVQDINNILKQTNNIKQEIKNLKISLNTGLNEITKAKTAIKNDLKELQTALKEDYKTIEQKYSYLKNKEYLKFTESFLKPEINAYLNKALFIYEKIKPYLYSENEKETYERNGGRIIKYEDKITYPNFILEKAKLEAVFKNADFNVSAKNLTDNQKLLNKPAEIKIDSVSQFYKKLTADIKIFKTVYFRLTVNSYKANSVKAGNLIILHPLIDIESVGEISNMLNIKIKALFKNFSIEYKKSEKIEKLLSSIKSFNVTASVKGTLHGYKINLNSDLDKKLSGILKKEYDSEIKKQKEKAKKLLNDKINKEIKSVNLNENLIKSINDEKTKLENLKKELQKYSEKKLKKRLFKKNILNKFLKF
ncbi:TIGR03545 family protein [Nautilia sp.]